ncbi:Peroxisome chaperone and import receptor [Friedmanniomyces endolithicus]|uniref:Peroxisome chaperone and import receptor n=1 Tax=Friedmanniomyces endolithicus TaxID=329885 RepID=A0AAN6L2Q8_9PEZI|nr:Peroxisome chaperone and import receptor [Friedmanniomyces endolithicus]KAK0797528.1 Peroxisome chaperone and import receptor [Friedmanniomyces endolithicus]KAK0817113.1 Peroxisome chaperone and import receptor [Friedmanniomyces endolithicus]KAK0819908.1 Peroxisome chaperone and import receptor [Friedmanniomyces endolithicus]KAK0852834.1 Peroxisome chaperone and import receptor [Friedmanniomyces endolithicus]
MAEQPHGQGLHAPDLEEDDLDDLDDVLDEFQPSTTTKSTKSTSKSATLAAPASTSAPPPSGPGRPPPTDASSPSFPDAGEAALTAQLQAGVADLMSELDANPDMQAQFEKMMAELIAVGSAETDGEAGEHLRAAVEGLPGMPPLADVEGTGSGGAGSAGSAGSGKKEAGEGGKGFNDTIRKTMARMQNSDSTASAEATAPAGAQSEEDMLAQMLRELQASSSGEGGEGGVGGQGDFNSLLMSMMTQLTNKEILYEPMKELHDKFPGWMAKQEGGKEKVGKEDMARYVEQQRLVGEIVARFETKGYRDENEGDREYIVERMQKMQAAGSPPPDLVGDMSAAQEALGEMDAGCPTQ